MKENQKTLQNLDCIVVGAGPAGLSASIYLKRANLSFKIFEKENPCSKVLKLTQLENLLGNLNSPSELAVNMFKQIRKLGIEISIENVFKIKPINSFFEVVTNQGKYLTKSLILSSGILEKIPNIKNVDNYVGKGVSTCVVCDAYFFKDKVVCFSDFKSENLEEILYLSNICKRVLVFSNSQINSLVYKQLSKLDKIELHQKESIISVDGIDKLQFIKTDKEKYDVNALFLPSIYGGNLSYFAPLKLKKDKLGLWFDKEMRTSKKGVYVCGDLCNRKLKQISVAIGDGAVAGSSVLTYLKSYEK